MAAETAVEDDLVDVPDRGGSGARNEPPCCGEGFVRNDADKGARSRFSLVCAFRCAWDGIVYAVRTQRNMKIYIWASPCWPWRWDSRCASTGPPGPP